MPWSYLHSFSSLAEWSSFNGKDILRGELQGCLNKCLSLAQKYYLHSKDGVVPSLLFFKHEQLWALFLFGTRCSWVGLKVEHTQLLGSLKSRCRTKKSWWNECEYVEFFQLGTFLENLIFLSLGFFCTTTEILLRF